MQTIEMKVRVESDRTLSLQLPEGISAGDYEIVLVLNQQSSASVAESGVTQSDVLEDVRVLLNQSVEPNHSLADELIREQRAAFEHE